MSHQLDLQIQMILGGLMSKALKVCHHFSETSLLPLSSFVHVQVEISRNYSLMRLWEPLVRIWPRPPSIFVLISFQNLGGGVGGAVECSGLTCARWAAMARAASQSQ